MGNPYEAPVDSGFGGLCDGILLLFLTIAVSPILQNWVNTLIWFSWNWEDAR